jgi:hypothetical protein
VLNNFDEKNFASAGIVTLNFKIFFSLIGVIFGTEGE